jgi:hypothetical protein
LLGKQYQDAAQNVNRRLTATVMSTKSAGEQIEGLVGSDQKPRRGLETGPDRLAHGHAARDDGAINNSTASMNPHLDLNQTSHPAPIRNDS